MSRGAFVIPNTARNSTDGCRKAFEEMFGVDLNADDETIRHYAKQVPSTSTLMMFAPRGTKRRCDHLLYLLREVTPA